LTFFITPFHYTDCFSVRQIGYGGMPQLAKAYGVTEQLKAENQIEWVRQMNACVAQAEEAIKGELIYC
jgi:hypothetical protein